ncbi:hypothetical protein CAPTEDRAFT_221064 [Capitella teleta]|uniref:unspecific monooxygenase n=1 Tax=Capitella teleta TaxID=283909 RepID=R7UH12_CAPTE|nr:hypothetical protein CAPTEDRAFT_221064 [Capitella teleta]|eukprot:ELU03083.1 hypothetical protein CAPTEDRAFT_221064 [Capitella teleta]
MELSQLSENVTPTVSVFLGTAFLAWLVSDWMSNRSRKGVWGLPFVGQILSLGDASHRAIHAWTKQYGDVMWLRVGFKSFLVLSNIKQIKELTKEHASSVETKPLTTTGKATKGGAHYDVVPGRWKKRKTIIMRALKNVQKQTVFSIPDIGTEEIRLMIPYLEGKASKINAQALKQGSNPGMQLFEDFGYYMARLMYRINLGTAGIYDKDIESRLRRMSNTIAIYPVTAGPLGNFDVLPYWKFVKRSQYLEFCSFHTLVGEICQLGIERYLAEEDKESQSNSCVASHFFHLANDMTPEAKAEIDLTDEVLFLGVCDVFRAGTESMTATMYWFALYMSAFPKIQEKVRTEVDDMVSESYDNAHKLPYLQAVVHEVYRFSALAPFGKRTVSDSLTLADGTFIPKGTSVLLNLWALSRDPKVWNEPYTFNPNRFLKPDGSFDGSKVENMMPFGAGMRRCPGESSGKVLVPMVAAALIANFVIEPPTGVTPDLEPLFGISLTPKPYQVVLKPRH